MNKLNVEYIDKSNSHSHFGRGTNTEKAYIELCELVEKKLNEPLKSKMLDKAYLLYSELLHKQSNFVPVTVAGPANYNFKKADKQIESISNTSEKINNLRNSISEIIKNMNTVEKTDEEKAKKKYLEILADIERIRNDNYPYNFDLTLKKHLIELITLDVELFKKAFEKLLEVRKMRKNSKLYQVYLNTDNIIKRKESQVYEFASYKIIENVPKERIFIKFYNRPMRQLIVALKSRGFFWNQYENAWSCKLDKWENLKEWACNLETKYEKYL